MFNSKAAFFRAAQGKQVKATVVTGSCYEDWDDQVAEMKAQCKLRGISDDKCVITDTSFTLKNGLRDRVSLRSKLRRVRVGTIKQGSSDTMYTFKVPDDRAELLGFDYETSYAGNKFYKIVDGTLGLVTNGLYIRYDILESV